MNISRVISRIVFFCRRYRHRRMCLRIAAYAVLAAVFAAPQLATATTVRMVTTLGTIDIELYDDEAPKTVANFLRYAGRGDYSTNSFIHRSAKTSTGTNFVVQGGGYTYFISALTGQPLFSHIAEDPPIQNEFSPSRSNVRGTIAMAKIPPTDQQGNPIPGGGPDSATSEWFINLANNSSIFDPNTGQQIGLDYQNGGFTVFGNVIDTTLDPGMTVVDAIANLPIHPVNLPMLDGSLQPFNELPVFNYDSTIGLQAGNLVYVTSIPNVTATKTLFGTTSAYAADVDITLSNPNSGGTVDPPTSASWLATFTPPSGKTVLFIDEISRFTMTWPAGSSASRVVTLYHGAATTPNRYYAYGPTPDNPTPHWYDFSYDSATGTGAEIVGNKILLHFVKGQRGDDDFAANNNSITHTGAPVLVTDTPSTSSNSGGCSIAATPSPMTSGGDWILVSMFLAFVALVRGRVCRNRIQ